MKVNGLCIIDMAALYLEYQFKKFEMLSFNGGHIWRSTSRNGGMFLACNLLFKNNF
jgi:hypothetical protein